MEEGFCVSCGQWLRLKDEVLPYHDWPPPTRRVCSGAKAPPLHIRPVMTLDLAVEWRKDAQEEILLGDAHAQRIVDWLIEHTSRSLQALQVISRITEDEDGEKLTPEAKLALKTLRKLGHVGS